MFPFSSYFTLFRKCTSFRGIFRIELTTPIPLGTLNPLSYKTKEGLEYEYFNAGALQPQLWRPQYF